MSEGGRLAILSDTHGRLPERVLRSCGGAAHILHAGDVGDESFLQILGAVAPLTVVSGNVDPPGMVPFRARIEIAGWRILIQHVVWERGGPSPEVRDGLSREGADLVVFGHSHEPLCQMSGGTVFLNPGSAVPSGFPSHAPSERPVCGPSKAFSAFLTWTRLRAPLLSSKRVSN